LSTALITGGAGFIGSHIVEHLCRNTDWNIIIIDRLNYAGRLDRLLPCCAKHEHFNCRDNPRVRFEFFDFRAAFPDWLLERLGGVDYIIHAGAETHVENSLHRPGSFVESNVVGTFNMLEAARRIPGLKKFVYVSTDEVHGPAPGGVDFREDAPMNPSNPYSATKAGAEALVLAWAKCYQLPAIITRTMNNFGERQHPEKFIPMCIKKVLSREDITIHGRGTQSGSRKWLHARNHADAILFLLRRDTGPGEIFHVAGLEQTNLAIAQRVSAICAKGLRYKLVDFHASRPGHDLRYSLDDSKLRGLGWVPPVDFAASFEQAVRWTLEHPEWLNG
jgi:dTDP-glucose 4,6-dehydratase